MENNELTAVKYYNVLDHDYENTGGNCMVSVFEVWLTTENRTVYVMATDTDVAMTTVDHLRNNLEFDDSMLIDEINVVNLTRAHRYFELYRYCWFEFLKKDTAYFHEPTVVHIDFLPPYLRDQITANYAKWLKDNDVEFIKTDGYKIITDDDYCTDEEELMEDVKCLRKYVSMLIPNSDACYKSPFDTKITFHFNGKKITMRCDKVPYDAIVNLLKFVESGLKKD